MLEFTKLTNARLPVILKDSTSNPVIAAQYNAVQITIIKDDGTQADLTVLSASWSEITGAAYSSQGYYNYVLTGTYLDVTGVFQYSVLYTGSVPYFGVVKVTEGDTGAVFNRIGIPISGTISNDIQNVPAAASSGGFTSGDRAYISQTFHSVSLMPADVASNTHVDYQISQSFWIGDRQNLTAIKAKTDLLPSDPASNATVNGYVNSAVTSINNNATNGFTQIKGASWGSDHTLYNIGVHTSYSWSSGALQSFLSYTFATITGNGYVSGTDDLHALSVAIQGITPGSGGGGFSTSDRTMLQSAYSQTLPLPADPASQSALSQTIHSATLKIQGLYPYGASTGTNPLYPTLYNILTASNAIKAKTDFIQNVNYVPTYTDLVNVVTSGVNVLAGANFITNTSSLGGIYAAGTASSFTSQDRTWISQTFTSQSLIRGDISTVGNNVLNIKSKTDLLPNDVVSSATIFPLLYEISGNLASSGGFSTSDRNNITAIKTKTDTLPAHPADADITFNTSDRSIANQIYSKTSNLPVDPVSTTYVTLVSQSLATTVINGNASVSGAVSSSNNTILVAVTNSNNTTLVAVTNSNNTILVAVTNSFNSVDSKLGTPFSGTVAAALTATYHQAALAAAGGGGGGFTSTDRTLLSDTKTSADAAAVQAEFAKSSADNAASAAAAINTLIGVPFSGSVALALTATYHQAALAAVAGGGGGPTDLTPVLNSLTAVSNKLGTPVDTVSRDVYEVAKLISKLPKK
jgi:hypothetical protein